MMKNNYYEELFIRLLIFKELFIVAIQNIYFDIPITKL